MTHLFPRPRHVPEAAVTPPTHPTGSALTETVHRGDGVIRASGHLSPQGADLLSGTADSLRGNGHVRVVLDLEDVRSADSAGLDILSELERSFAADGDELLIRHAPDSDRA